MTLVLIISQIFSPCTINAILTMVVTLVFLEGKSALGLAADHARMEDFLEIAGSLVIAGCRGTDKDWAILGRL